MASINSSYDAAASAAPPAAAAAWWKALVRGRAAAPAWERPALLALLALSAALFLVGLDREGMANGFYSAAVMSGAQGWKAFFFGSFDAASFITVDKPPVALWVMELSARAFGFSSWSMLVPEALAGVVAVGLTAVTVRRWAGPVAGLVAGLALALTPVAALMFRYNNPDAVLTLLLVASAYAAVRAVESGRVRWLVLGGVLLGFAFNTKMLQAFLVLPAFALVYLVAAPGRAVRRIGALLAGGVALAVSAGWWPVVVSLVPAASRPYVDNSTNDSIWSLILGYNGLGRIFGSAVVGGGGGGGGFGGGAGLGRLFGTGVGGQVSWLLPFAGLALVVGLAMRWRAPRTDLGRAGYLLWGGWAVTTGAVFSLMTGTFHPYYTVALAPAIGALVGMGVADLWRQRRAARTRWLLPAAIAASGAWGFVLLGRTPDFVPWLRVPVLAVSLAVALVLLAPLPRRVALAAVAAGVVAMLAGPAAYVVDTITTAHTGAIVSAGPAASTFAGGAPQGPGGGFAAASRPAGGTRASFQPPAGSSAAASRSGPGGGAGASTALVNYLLAHRGSATWIAAEVGSNNAAGLELASRQPVMAMGGFLGSTSAPTLDQFKALVSEGRVRYVVVQSAGAAGGPGPGGGGGSVSDVVSWAEAHGQKVTISGAAGVTVYDLQGASGA